MTVETDPSSLSLREPRTRSGVKARRPLYRSAALALLVEAMMLAGLFVWLEQPRELPPPQPMTIALAPPVQAPKPAPPEPKPVPPKPQPKPVVQPRRVPVVHEVRHVVHEQPPKAVQQPVMPPAPAPAPVPAAAPTDAAPVVHEAAPAPAPSRPDASFEAEMRAAIQSALKYPEAARMAGMEGRARVAFVYRDGAVSEVKLVISSGVGMLDRAAVAAVRDAAYPQPPAAFAGKRLAEQLWVNFNLDNQE
ncbi:TonB family protein [Trinickia dinghuensis]|uniref:TonB family protein n=1 Tax=Trinickia dinghuensis TaxID=2291023 RepID=A0A3D8JQ86_9BURK|nr:TonB family protein [Trinickia dinghuensis]RDU94865.1 TonB family protein [Trinickia dinghuensis]